eukprot:6461345-Amphidinium_carterae.1
MQRMVASKRRARLSRVAEHESVISNSHEICNKTESVSAAQSPLKCGSWKRLLRTQANACCSSWGTTEPEILLVSADRCLFVSFSFAHQKLWVPGKETLATCQDWKQVAVSYTEHVDTIRGLHLSPYNKFCTVLSGGIYDVIVDIREAQARVNETL